MTPTCRCHCRTCESHFASLEAFDAHRSGSPNRTCTFPDDSGLTELTGKCSIADDTTRIGVCVYSTERAVRANAYFDWAEGREAPPSNSREAA